MVYNRDISRVGFVSYGEIIQILGLALCFISGNNQIYILFQPLKRLHSTTVVSPKVYIDNVCFFSRENFKDTFLVSLVVFLQGYSSLLFLQNTQRVGRGHGGLPHMYAPRYAKIVKTKCKLLWRHLQDQLIQDIRASFRGSNSLYLLWRICQSKNI